MPVSTRSKTHPGQPPGCVTSPRVHRPRRQVDSRQGNAVVTESAEAGSPSTSDPVANGNHHAATGNSHHATTTGFTISKCASRRCMTCPKLSTSSTFQSSVTSKNYKIINHSGETISCHSQNLIYLLTCNNCNLQYVGETTIPLNKRINIHRTAKTGCEHMIKHYKEICIGATFQVQVLEIFQGNGYVNGKVCPKDREQRLIREEHWMKTLRTIFPYGLNERARHNDENSSVGRLFPPIPRMTTRKTGERSNNHNHANDDSLESFFDSFNYVLLTDKKDALYKLRVLLNKTKKKTLKLIASEILHKNNTFDFDYKNEQYYLYILDIIDTKIFKPKIFTRKTAPKHICTVTFDNKGVEAIRLPKLLNDPEVTSKLPADMQNKENNPVVTYRLGGTIRNKILNYKDTVNSIYADEEVSFSLNTDTCDCEQSSFCNPDHKHIITGDLRIVENNKLRKLLTKGPNYREPRSVNLNKAKKEIATSLKLCVEGLAAKTKHKAASFQSWKETILNKVDARITFLKNNLKLQSTKPTLCDPEVITYLDNLHKRFVIVPIDKAANNFAFICKKFYVSRILAELDQSNPNNNTYKLSSDSPEDLISDNIKLCEKFDLQVTEKQKALPIMYWMPKMHKQPVGARFIVASKTCSTKPVTEVISRIFKMIFAHVESFHTKSKFYSNFKKFWVVQNSFPIIEKLKRINLKKNAKSIATFDFSTLYTTIPHDLLIKVLSEIITFVFKSSIRNRIGFSPSSIYWTSKGMDKRYFTKQSLIDTVSYLIKKCYFRVGNQTFKQDIGIPMGIDPAPFWANLFLFHYEDKFVQKLVSSGSPRAYKYHGTNRFIDDLCAINDGDDFLNSYKEIYPKELDLKVEHHGNHATFLDLDITIVDNIFVYKLFDKRDKFPFFIVRMPQMCSNIPSSVFYGATFSEFLRIARCTLLLSDFAPRASELYKRMKTQGATDKMLHVQMIKACDRYPDVFLKFGMKPKELADFISSV